MLEFAALPPTAWQTHPVCGRAGVQVGERGIGLWLGFGGGLASGVLGCGVGSRKHAEMYDGRC